MIVKSSVIHKVKFPYFLKHWVRRVYNCLPSGFLSPINSDICFVFVVGCGHSGTTLIASKLSNHSEILGIGRETNALILGAQSGFGVKAIAEEWSYFTEFLGKRMLLEKTPKHIYSYSLVQKYIPRNKFVVVVRNPLDTIASLYKRFGDINLCVDRWIYDNSEAARLRSNNNVFVVKYEDFVSDPESSIESVFLFLDVKSELGVLSGGPSIYSKTRQESNMKLREYQVSKPIESNLGGWKKVFDKDQALEIWSKVSGLASVFGYNSIDFLD